MTSVPVAAHFEDASLLPDLIGRVSANNATPLYIQLQTMLRNAITAKVLVAGAAIPAERLMAETFNLSRITVRKAIDGLVEENLIVRRRGAGTFVASRLEKSFLALSSFSEDMVLRGRKPHSQWLSKTEGTVTPEEALSLGLSPGTQVCRFQRLRYADGHIMALEFTTVPAACLKSLAAVEESLYAALEQTGNRPVRALQRLRAVALTPDQSEKLSVEPGSPGLFIERRGFLADGRTCELNHSYYRCDAYDVVAEINNPSGQ